MENQDVCTICDRSLQDDGDLIINVGKGLATLIKKSKQKEDSLWKQWEGKTTIRLHKVCRSRYLVSADRPSSETNQHESVSHSESRESTLPSKRSESGPTLETPESTPQSKRSESGSQQQRPKEVPQMREPSAHASSSPQSGPQWAFDFNELCLICGKKLDRKHKVVHCVKDEYIGDRLKSLAEHRGDDEGKMLLERVESVPSMVSVGASYHHKCYIAFLKVPYVTKTPIIDDRVEAAFHQLSTHIEESGEFRFLVSDLRKIVGKDLMTDRALYKRLKEKYGDEIMILLHKGREPVVLYKTFNISEICSDWYCKESLGELQKKTILTVAAEMLRAEILEARYENEYYPAPNQFFDNVTSDIPPLLTNFIGELLLDYKASDVIDTFVKRDFISHQIVSAIRPKAFMSTLQLGLGTYVYRTGSRLIIDLLSKLGACTSYHNIQLHEASTIMDPPMMTTDDTFVQFVYDNTDHNVATLDGKHTFHCLGGIQIYTPEQGVTYEGGSRKLSAMPSAAEIARQKCITTIPYGSFNSDAMKTIEYVATKNLRLGKSPAFAPSYAAYVLARSIKLPEFPTWKGFMEKSSLDISYEVSRINCLPFINAPPSDLTTLNTSLYYAATESRKLGQKTCFVTYDQPLYWKARSIVAHSTQTDGILKNVVVRLGIFHAQMSYLGSIGYIMTESGIEELWSTVYAPLSVKKMMSGHAYARAVRAHILSFTALGIIICEQIGLTDERKASTRRFFADYAAQPPSLENYKAEQVFRSFGEEFEQKLNDLERIGPTAKLWVQYFRCVTVLLQVIEAQRLGDWKLHLQSIENMLPLFHAAGHFPYAKSAQIYLQDMANLEMIMEDEEFINFTRNGYFTIHRSDKAWSGLATDIVIEQTLNRFFGTDLKHGRGVTPSVVARYLLTMPSTFSIMESLENYCGLTSSSSEQHVDLSKARIVSDQKDIEKMLFWLHQHNPFENRQSLISLSTGIIGGPQINCHMAIERGLQGMEQMIGKNADNVALSKLYTVKTLATAKDGVHIEDKKFVGMDTFLLFQRISVAFNGNEELTRHALTYELSPFPLTLFHEHGFMRKTPKAELYKILKPAIQEESVLSGTMYVIDGGWLLHQVHWPHGHTYSQIFAIYKAYITNHYGSGVVVVFDGYRNELIGVKSYERYCRKEKGVAADVEISEDALATITQSKFLTNIANKSKLVDLLVNYLQRHDISCKIAPEDADTLIINTAIELKESHPSVTVVGNDSDLFVLLIALTPPDEDIYFYKKTSAKTIIYSTSQQSHLKSFILFAHAFSGCDSTSALYKKGKKKILSLLQTDVHLQESASIFYKAGQNVDELCSAAEQFIKSLYKGDGMHDLSINEMRYRLFISSVNLAKKELSLAVLPPTNASLREHTKRVYYQVQQWLGNYLQPEDWGWKRIDFMLVPIMSTVEPAPKELLQKVSCGCKTNCNTARCGCKKTGVQCTQLCKSCHGQTCKNASKENTTNESETTDQKEDDVEREDRAERSPDDDYPIFYYEDESMDVDLNEIF